MLLRPDWEPRISRMPPLETSYRTNISNQDINDRFLSDSYPLETSGGPYRHSRELQLRSRDPSLLRERRKKTVRFDSGNLSDEIYESEADLSEGWLTLHDQGLRRIKRHPWTVGTFPGRSIPHAPGSIHPNHPHWDRQESQDSTARDSGIDTSSCFTGSEDSNHRDPRNNKGLQGGAAGSRMVAHIRLQNFPQTYPSDIQASIGLKIIGGNLLPSNKYGAIIEKVKKGSAADIEGRLLPGDEVLEWNGHSLQSKTREEVEDILALSGGGRTVEMLVRRETTRSFLQKDYDDFSRPAHLPLADNRLDRRRGEAGRGARLQVKTWYDKVRLELVVTVLGAVNLPHRDNGQYRNPYAKLYLLPDRSERSKRRTKTLANTNHPRWNQSFVYLAIRRRDLRSRILEVTVWDYDRFGANEFLGEVTIDLAVSPLDEEAEWHYLSANQGRASHHGDSRQGWLSDSPVSDYDEGYSLYRDNLVDGRRRRNHRSHSPHRRQKLNGREDRWRSDSYDDRCRDGSSLSHNRFHSLDSRLPHHGTPLSYADNADFSDSDSEWLEDRDGWSDRRNVPRSGDYYIARGTRPRAHSYEGSRSRGYQGGPEPRLLSRETDQKSAFPKTQDPPESTVQPSTSAVVTTSQQQGSTQSRTRTSSLGPKPHQAQMLQQQQQQQQQIQQHQVQGQLQRQQQMQQQHQQQQQGAGRGRRPKPGQAAAAVDGDWRAPHQNSVTHVDPHAPLAGLPPGEGRKRRLGLLGPKRTTITVHRSEEIIPEHGGTLTRGFSSASSDGEPLSGSIIGEDNWLSSQSRDAQLSEFIEGLGPGQLVGRQVLGSPVLGDIQLSLIDRRGNLELEVIRARGLQTKAGSKLLPAPWVKVYLVSGKKCLAKAKTSQARRTLDPLFQQQLIFSQRYGGCVLQVTIWGDYGRVEGAKVFMGVAQILLDNLDLSELVIGWYKLFGTSSLVSVPPGGGKDSALQDNSKTEIQNQVSEESISVSGT
ncbi:regulating synaptic membrane exocytosis protein 1 [Eurytemora carolleeae]|uniref:regulating synaptic membrane exocytosis protein 1 n=1 Tax=Eurytemora carolleeae TaxID=1294199 RepID=UPI000C77BD60|nr:regulating synaptic membrane exocytosis protein 1 [Eurytemora carolleeae]|eukprot:XP_023346790.1 regulating synaptic membrane exocytosis protein 1-like [Eurytemora affinis]